MADDDDVMPDEDVQAIVADAESVKRKPDQSDRSIELSQEFPVVIDDDEPISISKLPPKEGLSSDSVNSVGSAFDEDSNADIIILDESQQFLDEDDD